MTAQPLRIDERNHVEKPLLDQFAGLGWEIVDLDNKQRPADSFRESFAEVVMLPVLGGPNRSPAARHSRKERNLLVGGLRAILRLPFHDR